MRWISAFLALLLALSTPANADFSFLGIKNSLVDFVFDQISVPGELVVAARGVEDGDEGATDIVGLTVADADGVWLTVDRISVRWNPTRVLRGELEINRMSAAGVRLLRAPNSGAADVQVRDGAAIAETDDDPFDWPRSPIALRIETMSLSDVVIAPGVIAGAGLSFDATGAARDEGDEQSLALVIDRTDAVAGQIELRFLRDFSAANRLDLKLEAREAAGGIVASLAGLPPDSAARVSARGQGPLSAWAFDLFADIEDVVTASGIATINAGDRLAVDADFAVTPGPLLDRSVAQALSPSANLRVSIAEDDAGIIRIDQGSLAARDLSLAATGTYDRRRRVSDLRVELAGGRGLADLFEGVSFGGFGFDGAMRGPLDDIRAEGRLFLDTLTTSAVDVADADLNASLSVSGETATLDVNGDVDGLRLDRLTPEVLGQARLGLRVDYAADRVSLEGLRVAARPLTLTASGDVVLGEVPEMALSYELVAPDLAPVAAAYDLAAQGRLSARGTAEGPLAAILLKGALAAEALALNGEDYGRVDLIHEAVIDEAPSGSLSLTARGARFEDVAIGGRFGLDDRHLRLSDLSASALGAEIGGEVVLDLETALIEGSVDLSAPDLEPFSRLLDAPVEGAVTGQVRLLPVGDEQALTADLSAHGIAGLGAALAEGRIRLSVADALGAADVEFDLAATGAGAVEARIANLSGTGTVTGAGTDQPRADVTLTADGISAPGAQVAAVRARITGGLDQVKATARLDRLSAGEARAAALTVEARILNVASEAPRLDVRAALAETELGPLSLPETTLTARGGLSGLNVELSALGALSDGTEIEASAQARADVATETRRVGVSRLSVVIGEEEFALRDPLTVRMAGGVTALRGLSLEMPGAHLAGEATAYPAGLAGTFTLSATELGRLSAVFGLPVEQGHLTVEGKVDTRQGRAGATVGGTARDVRFADAVADVGVLGLDATAEWDGRQAVVRSSLSGPFAEPLRARISLPLRPSGGALPGVPGGAELSGAVDWRGDLGEIWALVPAPGHVLDGDTRIALTLGGTIDAPTFGGDIAVADGRYENLDTGTILTDLNLNSRLAADGGLALDLTASDGAGAEIRARAELDDGRLDATLQARDAVLVRRDDVTAALSLDISARGPLASPAIDGDVIVERAEVRLVQATPPGIADLGEVRIKGDAQPEPAEEAGGDIALRVDISGPQDIYVRGRGLDSEWAIDLKVRGSAAAPRITGEIAKRRGTLVFLGKSFDLDRGSVRFTGAAVPDPVLDVRLMHENDGIVGGIAVGGTAAAPEIGFVSRPALPEEEVLPRVLFGRSRQALSPTEALNLAAGVATLMDGSGGAVDDIRNAVGVDVLRIEDDEDGPAITVGKNLADGVFVGAKQPVGGGTASVQVEIEVFDNFTIDSEVGQTDGTSIGLNWKKDF